MNKLRFFIASGVILCLVLAPVIALVPENTARAQPADSDWPMFRQNPQRTGSPYTSLQGFQLYPYPAFAGAELKWSFRASTFGSSPAIGADGTIYVGSSSKLHAINPDGTEKWYFTTEGSVGSSPAIAYDGTIYVGSEDGNLYAINPDDGTERWSFTTLSYVTSSPAIGADGTIYVGSFDRNLYAINPDSTMKWSFTTEGVIRDSPAIGADGTIYIGSEDGKLYAINPDDGTEKWSFTTPSYVSSGPAIGPGSTIYFGCDDGKFYGLNKNNGSPTFWWLQTGGCINSNPAIRADRTIYFGSDDGKLYALKKTSNSLLEWRVTIGNDHLLSSPAIGVGGIIYVGSDDGNLYAINTDGTERWSFQTEGPIYSSPAIGADGTIYVGSYDGNLYALRGLYTLTITGPSWTANIPCHGSVTDPGWGTFTYGKGEVVPLYALAEEGCHFTEWTGDVGTIADVNAAETTITMNDNYSIRANFAEGPSPGGCFIATTAYGSTPMAEEIEVLRQFRDEYLLTNQAGQALVDLYYRVSPPMAEFINEHPSLKPIVRAGLLPAVAMSALAVNTTPVEKMAIVGFVVLVSVATAVLTARRWGRGSQYT